MLHDTIHLTQIAMQVSMAMDDLKKEEERTREIEHKIRVLPVITAKILRDIECAAGALQSIHCSTGQMVRVSNIVDNGDLVIRVDVFGTGEAVRIFDHIERQDTSINVHAAAPLVEFVPLLHKHKAAQDDHLISMAEIPHNMLRSGELCSKIKNVPIAAHANWDGLAFALCQVSWLIETKHEHRDLLKDSKPYLDNCGSHQFPDFHAIYVDFTDGAVFGFGAEATVVIRIKPEEEFRDIGRVAIENSLFLRDPIFATEEAEFALVEKDDTRAVCGDKAHRISLAIDPFRHHNSCVEDPLRAAKAEVDFEKAKKQNKEGCDLNNTTREILRRFIGKCKAQQANKNLFDDERERLSEDQFGVELTFTNSGLDVVCLDAHLTQQIRTPVTNGAEGKRVTLSGMKLYQALRACPSQLLINRPNDPVRLVKVAARENEEKVNHEVQAEVLLSAWANDSRRR